MIKYQIKELDGYMADSDLPHNCIFNKARTGCGATTIAIRNNENYVIAVPTTELIINKCNSEKELFGLYGNFTASLKNRLKEYAKTSKPIKIMCTYDKLPKLLEHINANDCRLLVDEYHNLLKQYSFRDKAIDGVLDNFKAFKSFCFMSATPIETDLKPNVLNGITEYVADWKEPLQLCILPYQTNKPYQFAANIIGKYKLQGYFEVNGHKSEEAYFFLNSVQEIAHIIKQCGLTNDNCRVICANTSHNQKKLGEIKISDSLSPARMFNFITCKSFEGADFFSETGLCFVISNVYKKQTLASIDIDIPQIAGRIRNRENPLRHTVFHIFNTKKDDMFASYEEVKKETFRQLEIAVERVKAYNSFSADAKKQQAKEVKDSLYIRYNNGMFEVNDRAVNYILYEYKLMHQIYQSKENVADAYTNAGFNYGNIQWNRLPSNEIGKLGKRIAFAEIAQKYYDLQYSFDNGRAEIERQYPFIREAFQLLGFQEIRRLRSKKAVEQALLQAKLANKPNRSEMFKLLSQVIEIGRFYQTAELQAICEQFQLTNIKELREWYDIKSGTKRINGVPRSGYWIKSLLA
ncbi:hypothetical protein EVD33_00150 [Bacteroidales bacterium SW292]|nr:hypothetical protein [Bacteroidales bacterium SW292]